MKRQTDLQLRSFHYLVVVVAVAVVTRPLPRNGEWQKTMDPQNPGNLPFLRKQRVTKERAAQSVRSWTVQNETRAVL